MSNSQPLSLYTGFGIELEYMIVGEDTMAVKPIADKLLAVKAGEVTEEIEIGDMAWSNELARHVIELKCNGPAPTLGGLAEKFQHQVNDMNRLLKEMNACLMPSGAHPLMDPETETQLWPHQHNNIYKAYHRIFGCRGHGWSNLQSMHINLPFLDEPEFGRLHAAIRLLMPIMPALTASSPLLDGKPTGFFDSRMEVYRHNADLIPSIAGQIIPEPVFTFKDYQQHIFARMYQDIAPYDPDKVLQHEFLNSRGAIARFERNTIEIRILDTQEHPAADIAAADLIVNILRQLTQEEYLPLTAQQSWAVKPLADILLEVIRKADLTVIDHQDYLQALGIKEKKLTAGEIWQCLFERRRSQLLPESIPRLEHILTNGCLARRIFNACGHEISRHKIMEIYARLCQCLNHGSGF